MRTDIHIKRDDSSWTKAELVKAQEAPGRKHGKPHGSHILELADLRKVILLCPPCNSKFDWKHHRFRRENEFRYVISACDACKTLDTHCSMYIAEETYANVRSTAEERRALRRWRDKQIATKGYL
jgi:hypothetical protein